MKNGIGKIPLGDLCEVIGGGTPSKDKAIYYSGKIPWATVRDMRQEVITETEFRISKEAVENSATNIIPSGNVVIATRVGLGKVCLLGQATAINQDLRGIIPRDEKKLLVRYLFWWLKSVAHIIEAEGTGATVKGVKLPFVKSLKIPLPPREEQQRIVRILDEVFADIATATANVQKNLQNVRALFASHLQSVFTQRHKDWVEKSLGEVCEYVNGKAHEQCIDKNGRFIVINSKFISTDGEILKRSNDALLLLQPGDIAMVLSDVPNGKALAKCFLVETANTYTLNQRICLLRSANFHTKFLFYQINRNGHFLSFDNGENQTNLRLNQVLSCPLFLPPLAEQETIANNLDAMSEETERLAQIYERKLAALEALKKSLLHQAFAGELTKESAQSAVIQPLLPPIPNFTPNELHAGILAMGYQAWEKANRQWNFGHVMAEKFSHMTEALTGLDLGREPVQDHFGPDDHNHFKKVEHRARMANYFTFQDGKNGKVFVKGRRFDDFAAKTRAALGELNQKLDAVIQLMLPLDMQQAEVVATVYAAWNNLLMDKMTPTDEQIVLAAREHWHTDKLKIPRDNFFKTIAWIRKKNICPEGKGKRVTVKAA